MFQITEVPGYYKGVLPTLKYRTNWIPDSNILNSIDVENFTTWKSRWMEWETPNRSGVGLLCSNLLRLRKPSPPFYEVCCREFYHPHPEDPFQVQTSLADEYGERKDLDTEERLNKRSRIVRDGDHFMGTHLELDLRHLRNANGRYPIHGNSREKYNILCIRQAIMDYFWTRKTSTVSGNFRRIRRDYFDSMDALIIRRPVPIIGTNEVRYWVGMVCALQSLDDSRRKGKRQDKLHWDSMCMTPTCYNKTLEAGEASYEVGSIYSSN